jgi:hypothetical protein
VPVDIFSTGGVSDGTSITKQSHSIRTSLFREESIRKTALCVNGIMATTSDRLDVKSLPIEVVHNFSEKQIEWGKNKGSWMNVVCLNAAEIHLTHKCSLHILPLKAMPYKIEQSRLRQRSGTR